VYFPRALFWQFRGINRYYLSSRYRRKEGEGFAVVMIRLESGSLAIIDVFRFDIRQVNVFEN